MIEWEETETGLRVFDRAKTEVRVAADDWAPVDGGYEVDRPVDGSTTGYASELRLPAGLVTASSLSDGTTFKHGGDADPLDLPADDYLLDVELNIKTYLRFSGPATVRMTDDFNELRVSFPEPTRLTFGFRTYHERPVDTVVVEPSPAGVATAITNLSASVKTTGPMRSYPTLRGHPPRIELGEDTEVPDAVRAASDDVGVEFVVPQDFGHVFVAAPLAYYLQADVTVAEGTAPTLRAPAAGVEHEFGTLPAFQHEVRNVLRRVFFLDCLVRNAGELSWDLAEMALLEEVGIDAARTYESTPVEQLRSYLDAPFDRVDDALPEWHLAVHVDPVVDNATCLPYFLDDLALVYLPESENLRKEELLNRSIDDFYRGGPGRFPPGTAEPGRPRSGVGPVEAVDRRDPVLHEGRVTGWLAEGVPIDVFKAIPEAYENRSKYLERSGGDIDVTVILNDAEMAAEHEDVADIYRDRARDLPIEVTVREYLSRAELADVFESHHDFVHYIGHCTEDGLLCSNGHLAVADLGESNVQTFFLNACGSYHEGRDLVRKGSVAGAVTFAKVLDEQAARVGVAFARLLINGFNIDLALQLARRRIMMGKDYAVVGDGSHVLTQADNGFPAKMVLERRGDSFHGTYQGIPVKDNGIVYQVYLQGEDRTFLQGTEVEFTTDWPELRSFLERAKVPVVYDGELYWSDELLDALDYGPR